MRLDLICRSEGDVHAAAIGLPARDTRGEVLVRISDTAVVLFLVLVLYGVRRTITAEPKLFDELIAFFIVGEREECLAFLVRNDVGHVLVEPGFVGRL